MTKFGIAPAISVGSLNSVKSSILEAKDILIISSPSIIKNPKVEKFVDEIRGFVNRVEVYAKIKPDAPLDDLDYLISSFAKPDLIIAIGGGSVIDSAKAIGIGWQTATIRDYFEKKAALPVSKIRTIAIPTTAGTGAEVSYGAILYDQKNCIKGGLRGEILQPNEVLLDTDLYLTAGPKLIAEVGFDCLTHAIETYLSTASSAIVKYNSIATIQVVFNHLKKATQKQVDAIEKMAISACLMGVNLALSSTCLPHRIQYVIGPMTNTSHAQGLIMLYPGWLPVISKTKEFASLCMDLSMGIDEFIRKVMDLRESLGINYSLTQYGIELGQIGDIASQVTGNVDNDPCYKSSQTIIEILKLAL